MNTSFMPLCRNYPIRNINIYGKSLIDVVDDIEDKLLLIPSIETSGNLSKDDIIEFFYLHDYMKELDGCIERNHKDCYTISLDNADNTESLIRLLNDELEILYDYIEEHSVDTRGDDYELSTCEYIKRKTNKYQKQYIQQRINNLFKKNKVN